jgi:cytochrome c biogenesis protein CcmG, thiol:disulfide interchange protein DsbE
VSARMRKLTLVLIALALACGLFIAAHPRPGMLLLRASFSRQEGAPLAPDLTLTDLGGKTVKTSSLTGKVVVVNFWAAWCTPCAKEAPRFVSLQEKYGSQGLQVIGISIDDADGDLRDFCRRVQVNYPVIAGDKKIAEGYGGILGLPTTFIIGRDGCIRKKLTGSTNFDELEREVAELLGR